MKLCVGSWEGAQFLLFIDIYCVIDCIIRTGCFHVLSSPLSVWPISLYVKLQEQYMFALTVCLSTENVFRELLYIVVGSFCFIAQIVLMFCMNSVYWCVCLSCSRPCLYRNFSRNLLLGCIFVYFHWKYVLCFSRAVHNVHKIDDICIPCATMLCKKLSFYTNVKIVRFLFCKTLETCHKKHSRWFTLEVLYWFLEACLIKRHLWCISWQWNKTL